MIEATKDGWRKPRSIYRSIFGSGVLTVGVIAIVCLIVVVVCHLFETPPQEVNALRYTYAHAGIIVAVASMIFGFTAITTGRSTGMRTQRPGLSRNPWTGNVNECENVQGVQGEILRAWQR